MYSALDEGSTWCMCSSSTMSSSNDLALLLLAVVVMPLPPPLPLLAGCGADFSGCDVGMDRMEAALVVAVSRVRASMDAALPPLLLPPAPFLERELRAELSDLPELREWADTSAASASLGLAVPVPVLDVVRDGDAGSDQTALLPPYRPGIVVTV